MAAAARLLAAIATAAAARESDRREARAAAEGRHGQEEEGGREEKKQKMARTARSSRGRSGHVSTGNEGKFSAIAEQNMQLLCTTRLENTIQILGMAFQAVSASSGNDRFWAGKRSNVQT